MAWLAVNKKGDELITNDPIYRIGENFSVLTEKEMANWCAEAWGDPDAVIVTLPPGSIRKLIGRDLTWDDEAVEI